MRFRLFLRVLNISNTRRNYLSAAKRPCISRPAFDKYPTEEMPPATSYMHSLRAWHRTWVWSPHNNLISGGSHGPRNRDGCRNGIGIWKLISTIFIQPIFFGINLTPLLNQQTSSYAPQSSLDTLLTPRRLIKGRHAISILKPQEPL